MLGQLVITSQANAQALAQRLVGNGVNISNVVLKADIRSTGFFNNISGTNIGIDSGIVLSSGIVKSGRGITGIDGNGTTQASNILANNLLNFPGDADLSALVGNTTNDACVLEFDFVPLGDSIKFNYVFGSEEYPDFACSNYNDAFAFFITGPGFPTLTNIALIPGSTAPVTIKNINDQFCAVYPQFFVANYTNTFFNYNGHTKVFTALAQVQPCQTYHLKLVIADVFDKEYDSGVFLQAKSLSSNAVALENTTQIDQQNNSYLVEGCSTGSFKIKRPEQGFSPLLVTLSYGGTAINGVDVQLLPNTITIPPGQNEVVVNVVPIVDNIPEGIEFLKVYALAGCNAATPSDSTVIQIRDYDTLGIFPDTAIICKRSSIQLLASAGYTTYQWDANPTLNNLAIRNPIATPTTNNTTYYCTSTEGTCHGRDSSFLIWKELSFVSKKDIDCKGSSTGQIKVTGGTLWAKPVQYAIDNGAYQDDSTFSNLPVGTYSVKIKDATNCIDSISVTLTQVFPDLTIANFTSTPASCSGNADGTATIIVSGGNAPYLFSSDGVNFQNNNVLNFSRGNYLVTVKDNSNCQATQNINIPLNNTVTLDAGKDTTICESKTVQLNALSNAASFVWTPSATLNNSISQNPIASNVINTKYFVTGTTGICTQIDSVTVFINPAPTANAGTSSTICFGQDVQLNGSGGIAFLWSPANYLDNAAIASPTAKQLPAGSNTYFLSVKDANGCVSLKKDTVKITVTPPAVVFAGRDTSLATGQPLPLLAIDVNNAGFTLYTWSPQYGLDNPNIANPNTVLDRDMEYIVKASTAVGCKGSDTIKITVFKGPEIYVPNAFTPNGDGLNDILKVKAVGFRAFHYFRIFNRWGNMIFTTTDPINGWDGTIRGTKQPNGVYVWIAEAIDYRGNLVQRKGTSMIIR